MKKIILLFAVTLLVLDCQDGPKAMFSEEFALMDTRTPLPFNNLVGVYELDSDSKIRYNISKSENLTITIKKDTTFLANKYLDLSNHSIIDSNLISKIYYIDGYWDNSNTYIGLFTDKFCSSGSLDIYYRKKDNVFALYAYTKSLEGQEHGDYLRYIKVKDGDVKKK
ncbi:MAG: hypothetical protein LBE36_03435 [Flavobacteriaceae bacterium]|jgi:hypothetical protein|nr:hypothetical protein [Flavobacteriaceae bacterium]